MGPQFTLDNTAGYTQSEINELNRRFEEEVAVTDLSDNDFIRENQERRIAERVIQLFDTELCSI